MVSHAHKIQSWIRMEGVEVVDRTRLKESRKNLKERRLRTDVAREKQ